MSEADRDALLDRLAVEDLMARYCRALDALDDAQAAADFFAEDSVLDYAAIGIPVAAGRDAVAALIGKLSASMRAQTHILSNFIVDRADASVHAECLVQAFATPNEGALITVRGRYRIEASHDAGRWRIRRLAFEPFP